MLFKYFITSRIITVLDNNVPFRDGKKVRSDDRMFYNVKDVLFILYLFICIFILVEKTTLDLSKSETIFPRMHIRCLHYIRKYADEVIRHPSWLPG